MRVPPELLESDPAVLAPEAGLVHVGDDEPGIGRRRRGTGFSYHDAFGEPVGDAERERIEALAVPPAWTDVWISPDPSGYLQASGIDDAGRKQYRYHDDFRAYCDDRKFARLSYFARAIVVIRKATQQALAEPVGSRNHAIAAAVALIDRCLLRVGNDGSAANGHYGATTLTVEHVIDDDVMTLDYRAKSGQERTILIEDEDLVEVLTELAADADDELFWFDDGPNGERRRATASDVNDFIVEHAGSAFTAKDFRTWGASSVVVESRAEGARDLDAIDEAAKQLGNTRAVARSSYIHPAVLEADQDTIDDAWGASRRSKWLDRSESALAKLLADGLEGSRDRP
ncbi:DNA topoisomerase IB [Ilumatobacter nonamiensis]|uniref:DNA topoisomerase IB n=1 Tax=Ilumatobacter nonamiensis TaxID=467093 RepID=UPI0019D32608|nr:DNA topoisomerase IB [Ilumatobacter nonamiensis]